MSELERLGSVPTESELRRYDIAGAALASLILIGPLVLGLFNA